MPPPTTATDGATSSPPDLHDGLDPGHRSAAWSIASAVPSDHGDTVRGCATPSTTRPTRSVKKQTRSRIFGFSGIGSGELHAASRTNCPPARIDQYRARPLYGHSVTV